MLATFGSILTDCLRLQGAAPKTSSADQRMTLGGIAGSRVTDLNPDDVMWRRKLPMVDMWECVEECVVRAGPHYESQVLGVLPKGSRVRVVVGSQANGRCL